ncbi:dephospho-CoA kinase [Marilutibacter aestuarii]|uniref:Dephospho-CoA kinase n=1 Tax=Marilutibacter aestuarii TaxID=1706195 RepID=A0A508ARC6_9GAMM|nr:dephospho-CoA kinase [Lysobacter aestuarii]TQD49675.1 dephospho-CoA kinase [Lysobacter aestuarii]
MSDYIIGVTGGVASGKSTVTRLFETLGVEVADADLAAREAVAPGSDGLAEVVALFGSGVLDATGALDRGAMRARVFNDADARRRLEAIIHPRVRQRLGDQCRQASSPYVLAAIPLLAEGGGREAYPWLDRVLVVDVPTDVQHQRLVARDGIDDSLAQRMIQAQATRPQRLALADDVIVNDGELQALPTHIAALDRRYRQLAG